MELGPAGRNIVSILNKDTTHLSSAYTVALKEQPKVEERVELVIELYDLNLKRAKQSTFLDIYLDKPISTFSILA